ncbi:MAG TPA: glycosyltransferase WbuB, partial [Arcobacter sp.]|nr:glycosyltransferase WbuB [Arcobacter sp.]
MKILFITDNFPPEVNAPATRTYEHCQEWIKNDVEVTVITCNPNFPHGKIYEGYQNKLYHKENIDGIKVIRVWSYMSSNTGFSKRVLDYFSFALSSFFAGLFQKSDIIVATS